MNVMWRMPAVAVCLACLDSGGFSVEPLELTCVQWNIGHFAMGKAPATTIDPADATARAREYLALLDVLRPDILGLSEYEASFDTAGTPSARAIFAGFSAVVGPRNDWQWNATMVRPGVEVLATECMEYPKRYQRTYALVSRCRSKGVDFTVVQTHLDWDCDGRLGQCHTNRQDQIRCLIECFATVPRVIISGDFNINSRREYGAFTAAGYTSVNYGEWGELRTFTQVISPSESGDTESGDRPRFTQCLRFSCGSSEERFGALAASGRFLIYYTPTRPRWAG